MGVKQQKSLPLWAGNFVSDFLEFAELGNVDGAVGFFVLNWEDEIVGVAADGAGGFGDVAVNEEKYALLRCGEIIYLTVFDNFGLGEGGE